MDGAEGGADDSAGAASGVLSPFAPDSADGAGGGGASLAGESAATCDPVSGESPSSVFRYGLTSALGSAACRRGLGRRPRRPGRRRSFMSSVMYWWMSAANRPFVVRRALFNGTVCSMRTRDQRVHARPSNGAGRIGTVVERERSCLFARRFRSHRVARSPHAIPATFFSAKRWPGMPRRSCRGATHPSLAQSAQPTGRRLLYEYRTKP